ncbi:MAG: hypothetical protein ACYTGZ_10095 [Planctomycetota bacterium]|jgi:hypothetical protein
MAASDPDFALVLDALLGRAPMPQGAGPATVRRAEQLLATGRSALAHGGPTRAQLRKADSIFRKAQRGRARDQKRGLLRVVFDSWLQPAPALRHRGAATPRFLRYEGACTVEVQIRAVGGRVELEGQVTPPDAASEAQLEIGGRTRRARIDGAGMFRFGGLHHGDATLVVGSTRVEGLPL